MKMNIKILRPGESEIVREVAFAKDVPTYKEIKSVVLPLLNGAQFLEHVAVLWNDRRCDMFVDDLGIKKGLARNERATTIYRNNWLTKYPDTDPESLPWIAGTAVLFDDTVWT